MKIDNFTQSISTKQTKLTIQNFRQELQRIKKPHLKEVKNTANKFHQKVTEYEKYIQAQQTNVIQPTTSSRNANRKTIQSKQSEIIPKNQQDEKFQQQLQMKAFLENKAKQMPVNRLRQWQPISNDNFRDYQDLIKNYEDIFQKRIPQKKKDNHYYDFRSQQVDMLLKIYKEIQKQSSKGVTFQEIQEFFNNYQLFHSYYNIHPKQLRGILKDFARNFSNMLNFDEFVKMMLNDRPVLISFQKVKNEESNSHCILTDEVWKDLKAIFDNLDTFGNETININEFIYRIKNNLTNRQLLDADAIQYPEINKRHTLRKIIFHLEFKQKHDHKTSWNQIKQFIQKFRGKEDPSIDDIYRKQIQNAKISKDSNYFYLDQQILSIVKEIFKRCPKYCCYFVKKRFIGEQLLESSLLSKYLNLAVRADLKNEGKYMTFIEAIRFMMQNGHQFLDLDQVLDYFSIKGPQRKNFEDFYEIFNQQSEEQQNINEYLIKRKLKKIKSLEQLNDVKVKLQVREPFRKIPCYTNPQQFNLSKKYQNTIRQIKVKKMIEQKEQQDIEELSKKFKANPIPVSVNHQHYEAYLRKMKKKKQQIMQKFQTENQKVTKTVEYLKTHTKIFEPIKNINQDNNFQPSPTRFEPKPVPWFVQNNILGYIEGEKRQRRKQIYEKTKKKHQNYQQFRSANRQKVQTNQSLLSIIPRQNPSKPFKSTPIPNFQFLQNKFEKELALRKKEIKVTQPQQFKFSEARLKAKKQDGIKEKSKEKMRSLSNNPRTYSPMCQYITQTKKSKAWFKLIKKRKLQKEKEMRKIQQEQIKRKQKKSIFLKFMKNNLIKFSPTTNVLKSKQNQRLQIFKQKQLELQEAHHTQLAQMYERVIQRPFLFQSYNSPKHHPKLNQYNNSSDQQCYDNQQKPRLIARDNKDQSENQQQDQYELEQQMNKSADY